MAADRPICLKVSDLKKQYGGRMVVNGLSFQVGLGEIVGLLGPNGAGKTTAFYMTVGLIQADGGRVEFNNIDVTHLAMHERARMGMGYLAQEPSVFRNLTVEENILAILETLPLPKKEKKKTAARAIARAELGPFSKKNSG